VNVVMNVQVPYNAVKPSSGYINGGLSSSFQLHRVSYVNNLAGETYERTDETHFGINPCTLYKESFKKVNEELFLDNPLHVILNKSKLAYRIYVILIANKELISLNRLKGYVHYLTRRRGKYQLLLLSSQASNVMLDFVSYLFYLLWNHH
jgi:hypothetical protein